jgi:hypothetical protein
MVVPFDMCPSLYGGPSGPLNTKCAISGIYVSLAHRLCCADPVTGINAHMQCAVATDVLQKTLSDHVLMDQGWDAGWL